MKDRKIQVSTCVFSIHDDLSEKHPMTYEENLAQAKYYLEKAGRAGSDIMLLPEAFNTKGLSQWFRPDEPELVQDELAEKIPGGKTLEIVSNYAKKYSMHVAACLVEKDKGKFYNTVALVDKKGNVSGKYRKTHLPGGEKNYFTQGDSLPVFKTDFGTIGFLTCYDLNFPEAAITLSLKGAEMILWPTMWQALLPSSFYYDTYIKATAMMNGVYFVASGYAKQDPDAGVHGRGAIVSPAGLILADTGFTPGFATSEVWLERCGLEKKTCDLATHKHEFKRREMGLQRRPELYKIITDKKRT